MAKEMLMPVDTATYKIKSHDQENCWIEFEQDVCTISLDIIADEWKDHNDKDLGKEEKRTFFRSTFLRSRISSISINLLNKPQRYYINFCGYGMDDHNVFFIKREKAEDLLRRSLEWCKTGIVPTVFDTG